MRTLRCPTCGAPLPPRSYRVVVQCTYCGASVAKEDDVVAAADFKRALADLARDDGRRPRVEVAGVPYRVLGRIAAGDSSEVFLAERAHPITERVILKVLRSRDDEDLLDAEHAVLSALHERDDQGAGELRRRLPPLVARGPVTVDGQRAPRGSEALVLRALSGFVDTFDDVLRVYPAGVDGRHAVWMWRRVLELLAGIHHAGWVHGAVLPQHLVVHARDHGVMLVGWSCAVPVGSKAPLRAASFTARECYPPALLDGAPPSPATDITMSARCIARLLGGAAERVPDDVARPIASLVEEHAVSFGPLHAADAWALRKRLGDAAREAYGPPRYHAFSMPGWRSP